MQSACATNIIRNGFLCVSWKALRRGYVIEWSPPKKTKGFFGGSVVRWFGGSGRATLSPGLANISLAFL